MLTIDKLLLDSLNVKQIQKTNDIVSPRCGHASELIGNAFLVYGGDTRVNATDALDDNLYSFNICVYTYLYASAMIFYYLLWLASLKWTRAETSGPRPGGRYGHSLSIIGTKVYVFGGQRDEHFFNDLYSFDLSNGEYHIW